MVNSKVYSRPPKPQNPFKSKWKFNRFMAGKRREEKEEEKRNKFIAREQEWMMHSVPNSSPVSKEKGVKDVRVEVKLPD